MSRTSLIAALPIAGLIVLGGAGTAFAASPTTGSAAQPAPTVATFGGGTLRCDSPAGCPNGGDRDTGDDSPDTGPRHNGHRG
jgi:hypothetical protein